MILLMKKEVAVRGGFDICRLPCQMVRKTTVPVLQLPIEIDDVKIGIILSLAYGEDVVPVDVGIVLDDMVVPSLYNATRKIHEFD